MSAGTRLLEASVWTSVYKGPSAGFFYITNLMDYPIRINWKVKYSSLWFYSSGNKTLEPGVQTTIWYGTPNPYANVEVRSAENVFVFAS